MKVLGNLSVEKDINVKYPFGSNIKNETETVSGTPVVREIYGDVLMNLYKLLELTGATPTDTDDNNDTQYQIIEAIKKLPNSLNDIEQILSLSVDEWSAPLDLAYLPNKYVFVARATDSYVSGVAYSFKGTGLTTLPFSSNGFSASDEVMVVIDSLGVRAYSLTQLSNTPNDLLMGFGNPLAFNDTSTMRYLDGGNLYTDYPNILPLENNIRFTQSDGELIVYDCFIFGGYIHAIVKKPSNNNYYTCTLDLSGTVLGFVLFDTANIKNPYFYTDGVNLYTSDWAGSGYNEVDKFSFDSGIYTWTNIRQEALPFSFVKTTNSVVKNGDLYTLVSGVLDKYNFDTTNKTNIANFNQVNGQIFSFNGSIYFTTGEVAKKWII